MGVSTCDLMDRRLLTIARNGRAVRVADPRRGGGDAAGRSPATTRTRSGSSSVNRRAAGANAIWLLMPASRSRRRARSIGGCHARSPTLYRLKGTTQAVPFIGTSQSAKRCQFFVRMQNVFKNRGNDRPVRHLGHGRLHLRPSWLARTPAFVGPGANLYDRLASAARSAASMRWGSAQLVWQVGRCTRCSEKSNAFSAEQPLESRQSGGRVPQPLTRTCGRRSSRLRGGAGAGNRPRRWSNCNWRGIGRTLPRQRALQRWTLPDAGS
jgi:hypothetical protein